MLVLSRKDGESIMINKDICITIVRSINGKVDVGISAPKSVSVHRKEVLEIIENKNKETRMKELA